MSRDEVVGPVAKGTRENRQQAEQSPCSPETTGEGEHGVRFHPYVFARGVANVLYEHERVHLGDLRMPVQDPPRHFTDEGGEPEATSSIDSQKHAHGAVAEAADAVEEEDRAVVTAGRVTTLCRHSRAC